MTDVEDIWVRMTEALAPGEKVHIVAYDEAHRQHIASLLASRSVPSDRIDYLLAPTDDSWARDTWPIFVKNADGVPCQIVELPLTKKNVAGLEIKGSYINYYVANAVVLLPVYGDENDARAQKIVADLYPGRTVVPINVAKLYPHGGMIHCITQQQPVSDSEL